MIGLYESFGRGNPVTREVLGAADAVRLLRSGTARPLSLLAYGNGRSYGDTCQNVAGALIDMRARNRILCFNPDTGLLEAEAGAMLSDIITEAAPHGFFPAVVPGTQFVTLGGAVANDVHGKNHHRRGTFGCHVAALTLLRSDGCTYTCSAVENPDLFSATIGGIGLTGLILSATIRLMRVAALDIVRSVQPFRDLAEYFMMAEAADSENEYAVTWLDQLATGGNVGRGLLITGNHATQGMRNASVAGPRLTVPFQPPASVFKKPFLKLFNAGYRWHGGKFGTRSVGYQGFFFPLDGVRNWNWLHGPRGFYQHQSVIPAPNAEKTVEAMLAASRRASQSSSLTVLKRFGAIASTGILSFPRPGYTLTLDFPNRGEPTSRLLAQLDDIATDAGGAVNPYKDARMGVETFAASFPGWRKLEELRDPAFCSDFWRRTAHQLDM